MPSEPNVKSWLVKDAKMTEEIAYYEEVRASRQRA